MPTLEITTMVGCPLRCTFCPQDRLRAAYTGEKYLTLDHFRAILAKVPKHVRIDFSGMAEPWANPQASAMLRHALESGFNVAIYTTLYGMDDYADVIACLLAHAGQVETIIVHLPDANGNMRGFRRSQSYDAALAAFVALRGRIHVELMTMDADNVQGDVPAGTTTPWAPNDRAGNLDRGAIGAQAVPALHHAAPVSCGFTPFYDQNIVLPNGDVLLCCMDYGAKHRLGNLLRDDYYDLFASPALARLRADNMRHGGDTICKRCDRAQCHLQRDDHRQFWIEARS